MRHLIAALAAAVALTACGTATPDPDPAPAATPAVAATPAAQQPLTVSPEPTSPCKPAALIVDSFRERIESAYRQHGSDRRAMQRALADASERANVLIRSQVWSQVIALCKQGGDWGDSAELQVWALDVSLARLALANGEPVDAVTTDLLLKLDRAVDLA